LITVIKISDKEAWLFINVKKYSVYVVYWFTLYERHHLLDAVGIDPHIHGVPYSTIEQWSYMLHVYLSIAMSPVVPSQLSP
jgi:hypothetical protein